MGKGLKRRHVLCEIAAFKARPRFEGWWGNEQTTRFKMEPEFRPATSADAWQLSNPPIMALAPVRVSLELFDEVGMEALRAKSEQLTAYLLELIDGIGSDALEVITPRDPAARGCQLSILVHDRPRELFAALTAAGVISSGNSPSTGPISVIA